MRRTHHVPRSPESQSEQTCRLVEAIERELWQIHSGGVTPAFSDVEFDMRRIIASACGSEETPEARLLALALHQAAPVSAARKGNIPRRHAASLRP